MKRHLFFCSLDHPHWWKNSPHAFPWCPCSTSYQSSRYQLPWVNITMHWVYHSTRYIPLLFLLNFTKTVLTSGLIYVIVVKKMSKFESALERPLESIQLASFSSHPLSFLSHLLPHCLCPTLYFLHCCSIVGSICHQLFRKRTSPLDWTRESGENRDENLSPRLDFRSSYNASFKIYFPPLSLVRCLSLMSSHWVWFLDDFFSFFQAEQVQMVVWMLQRRLLIQVLRFVYGNVQKWTYKSQDILGSLGCLL